MKELAIVSGKGGTGKTSIAASFAALSGESVLADCDVDAADLYLVTDPVVISRHEFSGGRRAEIIPARCTDCGVCHELCRFDAVRRDSETGNLFVDPIACEGCGVCYRFCDEGAVSFADAVNGEWFVSQTRFGPMVHARLGVAEENSGKLVTTVRNAAREIADGNGSDMVIIDGSPGIGCPVIASVAGADCALIVTEPTLSGEHDLRRVADLVAHFSIPSMVCVNKWDINAEMTGRMESAAAERGIPVAGRISYDPVVTEAQVMKKTVPELPDGPCAAELRECWKAITG